jgi:hypothetical protein
LKFWELRLILFRSHKYRTSQLLEFKTLKKLFKLLSYLTWIICQQERFAKTVSIHPFYDFDRLYNDVAVVHLQESFVLAPHIDTVCLPDAQNSRSSFQSNKCFASGWGKDRFGEFSFNFAGYLLETSRSSENCSFEINVPFFRVAVYVREKTNT